MQNTEIIRWGDFVTYGPDFLAQVKCTDGNLICLLDKYGNEHWKKRGPERLMFSREEAYTLIMNLCKNASLKWTLTPYQPKREDADGWSEWQMWDLMKNLGGEIAQLGELPFETNIRISKKD